MLIELAKIGKPHGFRGEFVAHTDSGRDSALQSASKLYVGSSVADATAHPVISATWMPKGWKMKLAGIESDQTVKSLRGNSLFIERSELPPPSDGEFYVADLIGAEVRDAATDQPIGRLKEIETNPVAGIGTFQDRWLIETPQGSFLVPAVTRWVARIDAAKQIVWLRNLEELK